MEDLPYRAEYAKSGRASCKSCKSAIAQGTLRLAVLVQSPMFDGRMANWYHQMCFFSKQRPKSVGDIENYQSLRIEDQESIKAKIESAPAIAAPSGKKGKKRAAANGALKDFTIEYSKSSRATCRGCELKIMKDDIRVSKKDFETEVGKKYGGQDMWHHLDCFIKLRSDLLFFDSGENLPGFNTLSKEDKKSVKDKLPPIKDAVPVKIQKMKNEPKDSEEAAKEAEEETTYKSQNKEMYAYRDKLKNYLKTKELSSLLEANDMSAPVGVDAVLDLLADVMTFGALEPCKKCNGQYEFQQKAYVCKGNLTEWSKCLHSTTDPSRKKFKIPSEFKENYSFLKKYKSKVKKRIIKQLVSTVSNDVKKEDTSSDGPKIKVKTPPLYNLEFVLYKTIVDKDELKKRIQKLGGKISTKIHERTAGVISTKDELEKMGSRITQSQDMDVQVLPESFIDDIEKNIDIKVYDLIRSKSLSDWGSDPMVRIPPESLKSNDKKSKSMYTKSVSGKVNLKVKGGGIVDPDSGLEDIAHVYRKGNDKYTVVLGLTDLQTKKNSYYKLQILEADNNNRYWLFRAWGRIGTTVGGNKTEDHSTVHEAIKQFKSLYEEKSGNCWENRDNFVKVPGKMYPIDIDHGDEVDHAGPSHVTDDKSKLPPPIQDLVKLMFDIEQMKKTMLEFELDLEKMPLGKLSRKQLHKAFGVLSELQNLITNPDSQSEIIAACNRFYTLIPHDYGIDNPPLITTEDAIKVKLDMLDNLMELEIAYNLLKTSDDTKNPIDAHYEQLKTDIELLDHKSEEFKIIQEYVKNTHAETHSNYDLEILEAFKINRHGEDKRYKPFRKLPNRKLLWHGSRLTNFAGILAQGLRIAPPEAPVTGYMFGKGIYFADMVSKSANYCCTNKSSPVGLMLLCEVALGNMYERNYADYVKKLPKGMHSVKGIGRTQPDPKKIHKFSDGLEVPFGKAVTDSDVDTALLYNEFIVYDVAQVNVKYLLKMDFKYKF